jgi:hypothetical protein
MKTDHRQIGLALGLGTGTALITKSPSIENNAIDPPPQPPKWGTVLDVWCIILVDCLGSLNGTYRKDWQQD